MRARYSTTYAKEPDDRLAAPFSPEAVWASLDQMVQVLLVRVGEGCRMSFTQLYERTSPRLYAIVSAVVPRQEHAELVLQELYTQLWSERTERNGPESRRLGMSWLISRARDAAVASRYRRRQAVGLRESAPFGLGNTEYCSETRAALGAPTPQALRSCLCALPDGPRSALTLAFYEGLDYTEIALQLGQDSGTVREWLRTAIERLRASDKTTQPAFTRD